MISTRTTIATGLLIVGLLSACGSQATNPPSASQPTEPSAPLRVSSTAPTQAGVNTVAPTDTAIVESSPAAPTTAPTEVPSEVPATQPSIQGAAVSFTNEILPIFNSRCSNCHGGNRTEEGLVLLTYEGILQGSDNGPVIVAGNADASLLVEQVVNQEMPKRGPKLTPPQIQLIVDWINQGALQN